MVSDEESKLETKIMESIREHQAIQQKEEVVPERRLLRQRSIPLVN